MKTFLEQAFGKADATTPRMRAAIREWNDLYYAVPRPGESADCRLPVLIVSKLCRTVFAEYEPGSCPAGPWRPGSRAI